MRMPKKSAVKKDKKSGLHTRTLLCVGSFFKKHLPISKFQITFAPQISKVP